MTSTSLAIGWVQLLALLAAEVGLVALAVALVRRWCPSAAWHRTLCQVGIAAVLVITACELSGSARVLGGWAVSTLAWREDGRLVGRSRSAQFDPPTAPRYESQNRNRAGVLPAPAAKPTAGETRGQAGPLSYFATSRPSDAVSDSMAVLWLCLIWAAGAALAGARVCLAQCLFLIFQFRRRLVAEPALVERVQTLAQSLGIRRRVRVIESKRLAGPIAVGLIRPAVGLPPSFTRRFDAAQQNAVLAHELAHLAAHDPFWCLLADVAAVLLWWHPGVWWLRRQLHLASEMAADEASLLVADGPRILAECLVELGARLTRPLPLGQLRVSGFRSHLGRRVQRLVHLEGRVWSPPPRVAAALVRIFGPMAMTAFVVLCTAWAAPQALMKGDSMKTMKLNWKRSLATFALLAAFNGPEATVAVAQPDKPQAPPAPPPEATPATPAPPALPSADAQATEAPSLPRPPAPPAAAEDAFRKRYGLGNPPAVAPTPGVSSDEQQATDAFRRRYGLPPGGALPTPASVPRPPEPPAHGSKVEAKLRQIVLDRVSFDGLPLSEVLLFLNEHSMKLDPDKTGVNFLINPNFRPVALRGGIDPSTGLPLAAAPEQYDVASVVIKFSLPLRNVTMKDLLDAIVMVADHPVEYSLEDFGVVFAAKPETLGGEPVMLAPAGPSPERYTPAPPSPQVNVNPMPLLPNDPFASKVEAPSSNHRLDAELADVKPQTFNIDFGPGAPSGQVGPAAAGQPGDFWNTVSVNFNDQHTETDLKFAGGDPSPIEVVMINLGGSWSSGGVMAVASPMLDTYSYPAGNKGGDSKVILRNVPPGKYRVYIYGHGRDALYYGDYTLTVGTHNYGRKQTSPKADAIKNTRWVEGSQYVKFSNVKVASGEEMEILIQPGGQVTEDSGRTFSDAMICGLQLIPVK